MDTLCIPTGSKDANLRLAQVDSMASIYKGAFYGLVLDAELMNTVSNHTPASRRSELIGLQTRASLACSIWMTRSWTLQEGQLPPRLAIKFKNGIAIMGKYPISRNHFGDYGERFLHTRGDGNNRSGHIERVDRLSGRAPVEERAANGSEIEMTEILQKPLTLDLEHVDRMLFRDCFATFFSSSKFANVKPRVTDHKDSSTEPTFATVWDELAGRSTTKPEDVPCIMTNMLDLTNDGLLDLDNAAQMFQTILLSLE